MPGWSFSIAEGLLSHTGGAMLAWFGDSGMILALPGPPSHTDVQEALVYLPPELLRVPLLLLLIEATRVSALGWAKTTCIFLEPHGVRC